MGRLTPEDIRQQEFKQSALGYNKEQVEDFLDGVAKEIETLTQEFNTLYAENKESKLALQTYGNVEDSLKETLLLAQKTAQESIRNAQGEADAIMRNAETEKNALLFAAKENLSEIQNDVQKLKSKRETVLIKLKALLRTNLEMINDEFSTAEADDELLMGPEENNDERIVDFSKADLVVDDLPVIEENPDENPEIIIEDNKDFEIE